MASTIYRGSLCRFTLVRAPARLNDPINDADRRGPGCAADVNVAPPGSRRQGQPSPALDVAAAAIRVGQCEELLDTLRAQHILGLVRNTLCASDPAGMMKSAIMSQSSPELELPP